MTVARERMDAGGGASKDAINRGIAHEARTDQELESRVPPVSRSGTAWRIAAAAALILALVAALAVLW
jgi:hypothetical protein